MGGEDSWGIDSLPDPESIPAAYRLQGDIERRLAEILQDTGHPALYEENLRSVATWVHGESTDLAFLLDVYRDLILHHESSPYYTSILDLLGQLF